MSAAAVKLSPAVKALISLPRARGTALPCPDPSRLTPLFDGIRKKGEQNGVQSPSWLTLSTAALVTANSPATLCRLYTYASDHGEAIESAAVMRETALKCISFSGIPRTINSLTALRSHWPSDVTVKLDTRSHRGYTPANVEETNRRGRGLWDAIYEPHSTKLLQKLADAHPDLPTHILTSHYSNLLSDPFGTSPSGGFKIGRVLTSVVAMACLRAQTGVSPQLTSHVFGLKKALLEGGGADGEPSLPGQEWLTSDEGVEWILESTDAITELVGSSFGPGESPSPKAKL